MQLSKFVRSLCCCYKSETNEISNIVSNPNIYNKKNKKNTNNIKSKNNNKINNKTQDEYDYKDVRYLLNINYEDTVAFIPPIMYGKVIKVYDGDTITIASKMPYNDSPIYRFSVRLAGIDSPEIRGGTLLETDMAKKARDALHNLIFGKIIELRNNGKEKYGRLLADLYLKDIHINKWMLDNKYAIEYYGGKKNIFNI